MITFLVLIGLVLLAIHSLKAAMPRQSSFHRRRPSNRTNPHLPHVVPQAGKATVIGESGAWLNLRETLLERRLPVRNPEDIHPLLLKLKEHYAGSISAFHDEIASYIRDINGRIPLLRAEKGFFTTIFNWFLILGHQREIHELSGLEKRYAGVLSENIRVLENTLHSPELAGAKAELEVVWRLRGLPGGYVVFNNVQLSSRRFIKFNGVPLQSAQLDHVVLSPAGVFIIETKRWSKQFSESGHYHNPFDQVQRARYLCWDLLRGIYGKLPVRSIILTSGSLPAAPPDSYTKVLHSEELTGYITWFNRQELTPELLRGVSKYFADRVVDLPYPDNDYESMSPSDMLGSAVLNKMRAQTERGPKPSINIPKGKLIPTDPPAIKPEEDYRFMPPSMRKEYEDRLRKPAIVERDSGNEGNETPKDLKYMPPEVRAKFEEGDSAD